MNRVNIWTQIRFNIPFNKNIWKNKSLIVSKRRKCGEIAKGHFLKIAETAHRVSSTEAAHSERSIAIYSISMAGYVTPIPASVSGELPAHEASTFCDSLRNGLLQYHPIFLLFDSSKPLFLDTCLIRITIANLCPNMTHFDAQDFSWCCLEEVMFLWMLSVHLLSIHTGA